MQRFFIYICLTTVILSVNTFADSVCSDKHGTLRCGSGSIDNVDYRGYVNIDGTAILNKLNINGDVDIQNAQVNQFYVRGGSRISKTNIKGSFEVVGNAHAKNSEFINNAKIVGDLYGNSLIFDSQVNLVGTIECQDCIFKNSSIMIGDINITNSQFVKPLLLNAKNSSFSNSKINDISVKKPSQDEVQIIHLNENTEAQNIRFENQKGIVVLQGGSKIFGKLEGGKIVTTKIN